MDNQSIRPDKNFTPSNTPSSEQSKDTAEPLVAKLNHLKTSKLTTTPESKIPGGAPCSGTTLNQRKQTSVPAEGGLNQSGAAPPSVQNLKAGFKSNFSTTELLTLGKCLENWHKKPLKDATLDYIQTQFLVFDYPCVNPRANVPPAHTPSTEYLASEGISIHQWFNRTSQQNKGLQTSFIQSFVNSGYLWTIGHGDEKRYTSIQLSPLQLEKLIESFSKKETITIAERKKSIEENHAELHRWGFE